jgi:hypothetical protein
MLWIHRPFEWIRRKPAAAGSIRFNPNHPKHRCEPTKLIAARQQGATFLGITHPASNEVWRCHSLSVGPCSPSVSP